MPGSKNTIGSINTSVFNIVFMNLMNSPSDFIKKLLFQKKTLVASSTETKILRNITLSEQCKTYNPFICFPSLQTLITQDTQLLPLSHVYQGLIRLNEWKKGYIALLFKNTSLLRFSPISAFGKNSSFSLCLLPFYIFLSFSLSLTLSSSLLYLRQASDKIYLLFFFYPIFHPLFLATVNSPCLIQAILHRIFPPSLFWQQGFKSLLCKIKKKSFIY